MNQSKRAMGLRSWLHSLTAPAPNTKEELDALGEVKLACIVNQELKMGKGKIAVQVGHASVMATIKASKVTPTQLEGWLEGGQMKVVLKTLDTEMLEELAKQADFAGLSVNKVFDAGHTQIPSGSFTVLAIGPDSSEKIDELVGHLKLL